MSLANFKLQKSQKSLFVSIHPIPYLKPAETICTPFYQCSARTHSVKNSRGGQCWQEQHGVLRAQHPAPRHCANNEKWGCCKNCHKIWHQTKISTTGHKIDELPPYHFPKGGSHHVCCRGQVRWRSMGQHRFHILIGDKKSSSWNSRIYAIIVLFLHHRAVVKTSTFSHQDSTTVSTECVRQSLQNFKLLASPDKPPINIKGVQATFSSELQENVFISHECLAHFEKLVSSISVDRVEGSSLGWIKWMVLFWEGEEGKKNQICL